MKFSNCCNALPYRDIIHDDFGFCSECMDHAEFESEPCHRCKDTIEPMEEIWYIKNKASCGYCTTSKEIENY
tara:strand:- start:1384 stop:1599 length:216 start_codon:yes stop_codon:yes gene_type:complete